jgi:hypothetical protein
MKLSHEYFVYLTGNREEGVDRRLSKQSVHRIDSYVSDRRKRSFIGPNARLAETLLRKCKVETAEEKLLNKQKVE